MELGGTAAAEAAAVAVPPVVEMVIEVKIGHGVPLVEMVEQVLLYLVIGLMKQLDIVDGQILVQGMLISNIWQRLKTR